MAPTFQRVLEVCPPPIGDLVRSRATERCRFRCQLSTARMTSLGSGIGKATALGFDLRITGHPPGVLVGLTTTG